MREMKDSGIEWIGHLPKHWKVEKMKFSFKFRKGLTITKADLVDNGEAVINYGQIHSKHNNGIHISNELIKRVPASYLETDEYAVCNNQDIIFADTSEDYEGIGNCVYNDFKGLIFAGYHTIIARNCNTKLNPKYCSYLFYTDGWRSHLRSNASGIKVFSITQKLLSTALVLIPGEDEQQRIASYLDSKCSKIDDIIEKQQSVIEKLKAYKQSIITEAVTKGLNPNVPMKDSGVEWIGEVPEHWSVIKLKYATQIMRGRFNHRPRNDPRYYDGKYPFIQTGDVARAKKYISSYSQTLNQLGYDVSKEFPKGSICMTIAANVGDVAILDFNACFPDSVVGFFPHKDIDLEYLYFVLYSMKQQFLRNAIISTQLNLNIEIIKEEFIPVTKIEEQKQIADYLDQKCSAIDSTIANKQALIEKLTAYKKSLIYEVVTGKKEV